MTGTSVIIISIIVVLILAFLITMIYVNLETNKVVEANSVLVESHLSLLEKTSRKKTYFATKNKGSTIRMNKSTFR